MLLINDDCIKTMKKIKSKSIDVIFADPPYFLSNGGKSISSGKIVCVDKGEWDKKENYENVINFTNLWLTECFRILKDESSIWVTGTAHNIFDVKQQMDKIGFKLINVIIWKKTDPPPLIYKNKFRFSYEFIIWADKGHGHIFDYEKMYEYGKNEMQDVWILPSVKMDEKKYGYHPTQKPECLLERIILCSSKKGQVILDPFMGSGTTGFVSKKLERNFIGIEKDVGFYKIALRRINNDKQRD